MHNSIMLPLLLLLPLGLTSGEKITNGTNATEVSNGGNGTNDTTTTTAAMTTTIAPTTTLLTTTLDPRSDIEKNLGPSMQESTCQRIEETRVINLSDRRRVKPYTGPVLEDMTRLVSIKCRPASGRTNDPSVGVHIQNVEYKLREFNNDLDIIFLVNIPAILKELVDGKSMFIWLNENRIFRFSKDERKTDSFIVVGQKFSPYKSVTVSKGLPDGEGSINLTLKFNKISDIDEWKTNKKYEVSGLWMVAYEDDEIKATKRREFTSFLKRRQEQINSLSKEEAVFDDFLKLGDASDFVLRGKTKKDKENEYDMYIYKKELEPFGLIGYSENFYMQTGTQRLLVPASKKSTEESSANTIAILTALDKDTEATVYLNGIFDKDIGAMVVTDHTIEMEVGILCRHKTATDKSTTEQLQAQIVYPNYYVTGKRSDTNNQYTLESPLGVYKANVHGKVSCRATHGNVQLNMTTATKVIHTYEYKRQLKVSDSDIVSKEELALSNIVAKRDSPVTLYFPIPGDVQAPFSSAEADRITIRRANEFNIHILMGKTSFYTWQIDDQKVWKILRSPEQKDNFMYHYQDTKPMNKENKIGQSEMIPEETKKSMELQQRVKVYAAEIYGRYYFVLKFAGTEGTNGTYELIENSTIKYKRELEFVDFELETPTYKVISDYQWSCQVKIHPKLKNQYGIYTLRDWGTGTRCQFRPNPTLGGESHSKKETATYDAKTETLSATITVDATKERIELWQKMQCMVAKLTEAEEEKSNNMCVTIDMGEGRVSGRKKRVVQSDSMN